MIERINSMTAGERRKAILEVIKEAKEPISGTALAKQFAVSRQIIVQDIAFLRTANYDIYSTPRGYALSSGLGKPANIDFLEYGKISRVFKVSHTDEQMEDELNTIVDNGGKIINVFIEHEVYGSIKADLQISCRRQVKEFMEGIQNGKSQPLMKLALGGVHYHLVEAETEDVLEIIQEELKKKGYLL